jgi:hypothetical protein
VSLITWFIVCAETLVFIKLKEKFFFEFDYYRMQNLYLISVAELILQSSALVNLLFLLIYYWIYIANYLEITVEPLYLCCYLYLKTCNGSTLVSCFYLKPIIFTSSNIISDYVFKGTNLPPEAVNGQCGERTRDLRVISMTCCSNVMTDSAASIISDWCGKHIMWNFRVFFYFPEVYLPYFVES